MSARRGGLAVVTGASSGLGRAYAESLAARGHRLLLVARRADRLEELAARVGREHGVAATPVVADLATEEGLRATRDAIDAAGETPAIVIANAGFGSHGPFHASDRARQVEMVRVNCVAVVDLAAHVLPAMVARGSGALVVMSSAAAFQPVPSTATYAATKAFELHLTEAIAEELRGTGVRALAVCPGPTRTEFSLAAGSGATHWAVPYDDVGLVVRATWRALAAGRPSVPTGLVARGSLLASRLLPRRLIVRAAGVAHGLPRPLKGSDAST